MKILVKTMLLAMAAMIIPMDIASAHPVCESRSVWIPAAQSSYGYWRSGYWTVIQQCHPPITRPVVTVVPAPITVQVRPRIPIVHRPVYTPPRPQHRPSPRPPRRR